MSFRSLRRRATIAASVGAAALIALALARPFDAGAAASFTVLDDTAYADVTIGHGAIKTNFIPARYCQPLTYDASTGKVKLPSQSDWVALVNTYDPTPADSAGYLVLDCEKLYLTGSTATIANRFAILKQLQQWTQEIRPNRVLGWYGLANAANISTVDPASAYRDIAQLMDLNNGQTAYFPSEYVKANGTSPYTGAAWASQLNTDLATTGTIDRQSSTGAHPAFPYIWPQYYDQNTTLIPASTWQSMLNTIRSTTAAGLIIWGGQNPAVEYDANNDGNGPWVAVTQAFLDSL
ncbi:hypothetical protein GQ57_36410 [Burkholderia sp. MSh2]|uniref:Hyaluronidase n=1 Tax=Burkholderia paludis TaxID=1506587 RepID=A0A6J5EZ96_9BURK|nr:MULTISPECIES: hypothetical protein [Burkholderia]KEZ01228.1 hypothetical protein GQ57_36410 [Burkholderia sp. MSh2]CAB3771920.1 hypothetical protein LMG30113_06582 [Burkholderia paludis]VWB93323.1 hypothetical protein BPA30113_04348 [Burkholderia paludis]